MTYSWFLFKCLSLSCSSERWCGGWAQRHQPLWGTVSLASTQEAACLEPLVSTPLTLSVWMTAVTRVLSLTRRREGSPHKVKDRDTGWDQRTGSCTISLQTNWSTERRNLGFSELSFVISNPTSYCYRQKDKFFIEKKIIKKIKCISLVAHTSPQSTSPKRRFPRCLILTFL